MNADREWVAKKLWQFKQGSYPPPYVDLSIELAQADELLADAEPAGWLVRDILDGQPDQSPYPVGHHKEGWYFQFTPPDPTGPGIRWRVGIPYWQEGFPLYRKPPAREPTPEEEREREAMERDHEAMEKLRRGEGTFRSFGDHDGKLVWKYYPKGMNTRPDCDDPADAILGRKEG